MPSRLVAAAAALVLAPSALAAYPTPYAAQGNPGVLSRDGWLWYVAYEAPGQATLIAAVKASTGARVKSAVVPGSFGIPMLTYNGVSGGLSHDGKTLVLQSMGAHRLLPGRIADRAQKSWVMQGRATARATTADGRWVYTLYANPGGYPFVHALDTVKAVAHCVGIPWPAADASQQGVYKLLLSIEGPKLKVGPYATIDRRTFRVEKR
jgi:hypothetical protein